MPCGDWLGPQKWSRLTPTRRQDDLTVRLATKHRMVGYIPTFQTERKEQPPTYPSGPTGVVAEGHPAAGSPRQLVVSLTQRPEGRQGLRQKQMYE